LADFAATSGLQLPPLQRIDVDSNPELVRRYGLDIPVLLWGGVKVCEHRLDEQELRRLLRRRAPSAPL
jgi:hypothetical protein